MPRSVRERIFYDRLERFIPSVTWPVRCFRKFMGVDKGLRYSSSFSVLLRKKPLYIKALAFERNLNNSDFDRKLRQNSKEISVKACRSRSLFLQKSEEVQSKINNQFKEQTYLKSLSRYKDGQ